MAKKNQNNKGCTLLVIGIFLLAIWPVALGIWLAQQVKKSNNASERKRDIFIAIVIFTIPISAIWFGYLASYAAIQPKSSESLTWLSSSETSSYKEVISKSSLSVTSSSASSMSSSTVSSVYVPPIVESTPAAPTCLYSCSSPDRDCADFSTNAQAQEFFSCCGFTATYDPMKLDGNGVDDGIACENI